MTLYIILLDLTISLLIGWLISRFSQNGDPITKDSEGDFRFILGFYAFFAMLFFVFFSMLWAYPIFAEIMFCLMIVVLALVITAITIMLCGYTLWNEILKPLTPLLMRRNPAEEDTE